MEGGTEPMVSFTLVQIERKKTEEGYDNSIRNMVNGEFYSLRGYNMPEGDQ